MRRSLLDIHIFSILIYSKARLLEALIVIMLTTIRKHNKRAEGKLFNELMEGNSQGILGISLERIAECH